MIEAEFVIRDDKILTFSVKGHAGLAPAPYDILCASASAMTQLVINTVTEVFSAELDLEIREEVPLIRATLRSVPSGKEESVQGVLQGLKLQFWELRKVYPSHLKVREVKN